MIAEADTAPRSGASVVQRALSVGVAAAVLQVRADWHSSNLILGVVQPAVFLLVVVMADRGGGRVDVEDAALGAGLVALWGSTVWACGFILTADRSQGTLAQIISRPAGLGNVLVGKLLGALVRSILLVSATVVVASTALGARVTVEKPLEFTAAAAAVTVSALVLGLLLSTLYVLTRAAGRISEAIMYPVFILGGLLVPLSLLPEWAEALSAIVSLRWGAELLRAAAAGEAQRPEAWLLLFGTTVAYALAARLLFARVLDRVRREGSLDLY